MLMIDGIKIGFLSHVVGCFGIALLHMRPRIRVYVQLHYVHDYIVYTLRR